MLEIGEKLEVLSAQTRTALGVWMHGGIPPDPSQACQLWSRRLRAVEACLGAEVAAITTYAQAPFELVNPLWQPSELDQLAYKMTTWHWMPHVAGRTWESLFVCLAWSYPNRSHERELVEAIITLAGGPTACAAWRRLAGLRRPPKHVSPTLAREFQGWRSAFAHHPAYIAKVLATPVHGETPFWTLLQAAFDLRICPGFAFEASLVAQWSRAEMNAIACSAQQQNDWALWEILLGNVVIGDNPGRKAVARCPPGLARMFTTGLELGWVPASDLSERLGFKREGVQQALMHAATRHKAAALSKAWSTPSLVETDTLIVRL